MEQICLKLYALIWGGGGGGGTDFSAKKLVKYYVKTRCIILCCFKSTCRPSPLWLIGG